MCGNLLNEGVVKVIELASAYQSESTRKRSYEHYGLALCVVIYKKKLIDLTAQFYGWYS